MNVGNRLRNIWPSHSHAVLPRPHAQTEPNRFLVCRAPSSQHTPQRCVGSSGRRAHDIGLAVALYAFLLRPLHVPEWPNGFNFMSHIIFLLSDCAYHELMKQKNVCRVFCLPRAPIVVVHEFVLAAPRWYSSTSAFRKVGDIDHALTSTTIHKPHTR